jgi:hypothetical protein
MAGGLRNRILDAVGAVVAAVLLAALAYRAWRETGDANSYALLADAFLHGRLSVPPCFDIDCVVQDGATYVIFPPAPGVIAMPFVAAFGVGFAGFIALGLALAGVAGWCWWRIARKADIGADARVWFLAAVLLGSPVFYLLTARTASGSSRRSSRSRWSRRRFGPRWRGARRSSRGFSSRSRF